MIWPSPTLQTKSATYISSMHVILNNLLLTVLITAFLHTLFLYTGYVCVQYVLCMIYHDTHVFKLPSPRSSATI